MKLIDLCETEKGITEIFPGVTVKFFHGVVVAEIRYDIEGLELPKMPIDLDFSQTQAVRITGKNLISLKNLPKFSDDVNVMTIRDCNNLKSIEGIPSKRIDNLSITHCYKLKSLRGIPDSVYSLELHDLSSIEKIDFLPANIGKFYIEACYKIRSLSGLHKLMNKCVEFRFDGNILPTNLLPLLKIKLEKLTFLITKNQKDHEKSKDISSIIRNYLPDGDLLDCVDELTDAGFEEYAKL